MKNTDFIIFIKLQEIIFFWKHEFHSKLFYRFPTFCQLWPSQTRTLVRATATFAAQGVKSVELIQVEAIYVFTKIVKSYI